MHDSNSDSMEYGEIENILTSSLNCLCLADDEVHHVGVYTSQHQTRRYLGELGCRFGIINVKVVTFKISSRKNSKNAHE